LNSDAMLVSDTVAGLHAFLEKNPGYAAAGPGVLLPDGTRQPKICGGLPTLRRVANDALLLSALFPGAGAFQGMHMDRPTANITPVGWLSGVCMLIRREAFEAAGGFDERFFLYAEDMDLCRRLGDQGWKLAHVDDFPVIHERGGSAASAADIIRNSVLQQKYFLTMLAQMFGRRQLAAARLLMLSGLALRVVAGLIMKLGPAKRRGLLLETSVARLKALWGKG
ncbi:MAG: glycosyltransferase family 2 protein, partial [Thermodesulfobacteriota bacterium]